tara:strand:- start:2448 stop:3371 length:924 start_codon:yes stop_codon:yes gene_type:complete
MKLKSAKKQEAQDLDEHMTLIRKAIRFQLSESPWEGTESMWENMSIDGMFKKIESFKNNTWIFFDIESTGLKPEKSQITEIAAIAVDPNMFRESSDIIGTFNMKSKFTQDTLDIIKQQEDMPEEEKEEWRKKNRMTVTDILSMTRHGVKGSDFEKSFKTDELSLIESFLDFVESYSNPMLVIQNADFDMPFTSTRYEKHGGDPERLLSVPVMDTKIIMKQFLIPMLKTLAGPPTDDRESQEMLKKLRKPGYHSVSQGVVSTAYGISADEWHNALADVKMMMEMLRRVMTSLEKGRGLDITSAQERRR